jgi:hypothetical protein
MAFGLPLLALRIKPLLDSGKFVRQTFNHHLHMASPESSFDLVSEAPAPEPVAESHASIAALLLLALVFTCPKLPSCPDLQCLERTGFEQPVG